MNDSIVRTIITVMLCFSIILCIPPFASCDNTEERQEIKILILPHFEIGNLEGDFPGEAQLFYEEYMSESTAYALQGGYTLYYNGRNKIALCITGAGKTNASACLSIVLSDTRFDFDDTYILAVGCAGGAVEYTTLGDVCLAMGVYDIDLGHTADSRDLMNPDIKWFHDATFDDASCRTLNAELIENLYKQVKETPLETTAISMKILANNFGDAEWVQRHPKVILGSCVTSDNYWKGRYDHDKAVYICESYGASYPYAITEMEDCSIAVVADKFGMLDRLVVLRVSVNTDVFMDGSTPETLWTASDTFNETVEKENGETLDIFEPAMHNLFAVGKKIITILVSDESM